MAPYPFAIAMRPERDEIAVPSIGFPFATNIETDAGSNSPHVLTMPAGRESDPATVVDAGLAYSSDGTRLFVSTGDSGKVRSYSTADRTPNGAMSLDGRFGLEF